MKIPSILILFPFILFLSCDKGTDPSEPEDITSAKPVITNLTDSLQVSETFVVEAEIDAAIESMEFYLDTMLLGIVDNPPYVFSVNSRYFSNGLHTTHVVARKSDVTSESDKIAVLIHNLPKIIDAFYSGNRIEVFWEINYEPDFESYTLLQSYNPDLSDEQAVYTTMFHDTPGYFLYDGVPDQYRYFRLKIISGGEELFSEVAIASSFPGIAFIRRRTVYVMNSEGLWPRRMTSFYSHQSYPFFTPDGLQIIFCSGNNLSICNLDGSGYHELIPDFASQKFDLSPDGSKITFIDSDDGSHNVYIADVNGENRVNLSLSTRSNSSPVFSPDGQWIYYRESLFSATHLKKVAADGSSSPIILHSNVWGPPRVSPDGTRILFSAVMDYYDLYTVDPDGSNLTRITNDSFDEDHYTWSPDGELIAYVSNRYNVGHVWLNNSDGSNRREIRGGTGEIHWNPVFTNDGQYVIYELNTDSTRHIYRTDILTGEHVILGDPAAGDYDLYPVVAPPRN